MPVIKRGKVYERFFPARMEALAKRRTETYQNPSPGVSLLTRCFLRDRVMKGHENTCNVESCRIIGMKRGDNDGNAAAYAGET